MHTTGILRDCNGDAIVEATILFPVMTMIFAALVLLAVYLPSQAMLQQATQYAATALATEMSDTWLSHDDETMTFYTEANKGSLMNVYAQLFENKQAEVGDRGEQITRTAESVSTRSLTGNLYVTARIINKIIYKELVIEATRIYEMPVDLSVLGFPKTLSVKAVSVAVVQNGDEFVRNIDLATGFIGFCAERLGVSDIGSSISEFGNRVKTLLGW